MAAWGARKPLKPQTLPLFNRRLEISVLHIQNSRRIATGIQVVSLIMLLFQIVYPNNSGFNIVRLPFFQTERSEGCACLKCSLTCTLVSSSLLFLGTWEHPTNGVCLADVPPHLSKMEAIVEAAQGNHTDGGKDCFALLVFPFPYMCVFHFFPCNNFYFFPLLQSSTGASLCLLDRSGCVRRSWEGGLKDTSIVSLGHMLLSLCFSSCTTLEKLPPWTSASV